MRVKSKDLRIGNFVMHNMYDGTGPKVVEKIDGETLHLIYMQEKGLIKPYQKYLYIPLNEEWLESFGFNVEGSEAGDDGAWQLGDPNMDEGMCYLWVPRVGTYTEKEALGLYITQSFQREHIQLDLKRVKYVHQLQNLYFALTGKELKRHGKSI